MFRNNWTTIALSTLLIIYISNNSYSQKNYDTSLKIGSSFPFHITHLQKKQGLAQNQILDLALDNSNLLLVSTTNGIFKFNGNTINEVSQDLTTRNFFFWKLWPSNQSKVLYAVDEREILHMITPKHEVLELASAYSMYRDTMYKCTYNGQIYASSSGKIRYALVENLNVQGVLEMIVNNSEIYYTTNSGTFYYNRKNKFTTKILEHRVFRFDVNLQTGEIYGMFGFELYLLKKAGTRKVFQVNKTGVDDKFESVAFFYKNCMMIGTRNGIYCLNGNSVYYYSNSDLGIGKISTMLHISAANCIFIGTQDNGLYKLEPKCFVTLGETEGLDQASSISSVIKNVDKSILVGNGLGTIYTINGTTVKPFFQTTGSVASLALINNCVLAGTWGFGLKIIKGKKVVQELKSPLQLPNNNVHASFKDKKGDIWIGTSNGIASGNDFNSIKTYLPEKITGSIFTFYEFRDGRLGLGGSEGLFILQANRKSLTHLSAKDGLVCREVRSIFEDEEGKIWIGTTNGGLYCYHDNKLRHINIGSLESKLLIDAFCIVRDEFGLINITSNSGLFRIKEDRLNALYYGQIRELIPFYYGDETGLQNTEFNGAFQNNYLWLGNGKFYFPSMGGLVSANLEKLTPTKLIPIIERVIINDTITINNPETCATPLLDRNSNSIKIKVNCADFTQRNNLHFQFKLERDGFGEWGRIQKNNTFSANSLEAGNYTFSVKAVDAFNDKYPRISKLHFTVPPFFYETNLFFISLISIIVFLTILITVFLLKKRSNAREKKLKAEGLMYKLELTAVHAQLNPHFIFNTLSTIKYLLTENKLTDTYKGFDYLTKIIRNTVEDSDTLFCSIKKEISIIENYIKLEKMRLNDNLEYRISLTSNITESDSMPHLYIQPFIENAIKHGIFHLKDVKGKLFIHFSKIESNITVEITDNGVGRKESQNYKNGLHRSKGLKLVMEKENYLLKAMNYKISHNIIDLYDNFGKPAGTTVKIQFEIK